MQNFAVAELSVLQDGHRQMKRLLVSGEEHLRRILKTYASYYNEVRTHLSLRKDTPSFRRSQRFGNIVPLPILGGLHHQYLRI
jgi:hypothetical protein